MAFRAKANLFVSSCEPTFSIGAMSALLNGHAGLSAEMAIGVEKAFGLKADSMLRMQTAYDLAQVRAREREIVVNRVAA